MDRAAKERHVSVEKAAKIGVAMKGKYIIHKEEFDEKLRKLKLPRMLPRISTPDEEQAVMFFQQMTKEQPHLHFILEYIPEGEK